MLINNFIHAIQQRIKKQDFERICEPEMVMVNFEANRQYSEDGENGSLAILYELILHKLTKIAPESGNALDIACGSGQLICKIANEFENLNFTGIDLSDEMLEIAKKNIIHYNVKNLNLEKCNMFKFINHFKNKKFDLITWNLTMHHVNNKKEAEKVINQALELLNENGVLFIYDIERPKTKKFATWFADSYNNLQGKEFYEDSLNSYLAAFSYKEVEEILKSSNWQNYEHQDLILGNVFQYACTKKKNKKINRKPKLKKFWQKRDYYFLKNMFRNI